MLEELATAGAGADSDNVAIDPTYARPSVRRNADGTQAQEIGPLRGGNTTKIHALTDVIGRPFRFLLSLGNLPDATAAPELLAQLKGARGVLGDKGYDSDAAGDDPPERCTASDPRQGKPRA